MLPVLSADAACHLGRAISTLEVISSLKSTGTGCLVVSRREKSSKRRKVCEQSPTACVMTPRLFLLPSSPVLRIISSWARP